MAALIKVIEADGNAIFINPQYVAALWEVAGPAGRKDTMVMLPLAATGDSGSPEIDAKHIQLVGISTETFASAVQDGRSCCISAGPDPVSERNGA